jgi:hypothetical protein
MNRRVAAKSVVPVRHVTLSVFNSGTDSRKNMEFSIVSPVEMVAKFSPRLR